MTIRLGSPDFLRMFPTVVWTLQLDEEATRAINAAILRGLAEIRPSAGEPSAGKNWQSGTRSTGGMNSMRSWRPFPVKALTTDNTDQVVVRVREGTLLLFPAWLPHSVDPNRSARERVSISFNIMFSACAATLSPPLSGANS